MSTNGSANGSANGTSNGSANGGHTILLGGIGGDSHSVGLNILRQALLMDGYRVRYLGTQNRLEHFSQLAALSNVVMISSMDGHAGYYLRRFIWRLTQHEFIFETS